MPKPKPAKPAPPNPIPPQDPGPNQPRITLNLTPYEAWTLCMQLRLALNHPLNVEGPHADRTWWWVHHLEDKLFGPFRDKDPSLTTTQDHTP